MGFLCDTIKTPTKIPASASLEAAELRKSSSKHRHTLHIDSPLMPGYDIKGAVAEGSKGCPIVIKLGKAAKKKMQYRLSR